MAKTNTKKDRGYTPKNAEQGLGIKRKMTEDGCAVTDEQAHGVDRVSQEAPQDSFLQK